jgi:putative ABC transport system substrate-binding protein
MGKRLELMHELLPKDDVIAVLVNPTAASGERFAKDAVDAAPALGQRIQVLRARSVNEIEAAFREAAKHRADGLVVVPEPFFDAESERIVALAAQYAVPTLYGYRENAVAGGLISFGSAIAEAYRQAGNYAGRILAGARPEDLPVIQPSRFDLVINLRTARTLKLAIPRSLLVRADELIE